jgi:hypothetical protein
MHGPCSRPLARIFANRAGTGAGLLAGLVVSWATASVALGAPATTYPALGDTTFSWGGYVKLDMIYSTASGGLESNVADFILVPGSIPIDAAGQTNYHLSARESRIWFRTSTPSPYGNVDTHVELDFLGFDTNLGSEVSSNASSLRLRHAFGTWNMVFGGVSQGSLLAGQTWTTIMDLDALPDIIDFGSPAGRIFGQQSQIRYTRDLGGGTQLQVALENPENTLRIDNPADIGLVDADTNDHGVVLSPRPQDDIAPDTIAKYRFAGPWGHVAAAGIARLLRQKDEYGAENDADLGYVVHVSGKVMVGGKHNLRFDGSYGHGLGRYMTFGVFTDGFVDDNGEITPIDIAGTIVSGQFWLNDITRINLAFSLGQALNNPSSLRLIANERVLSTHANIQWDLTRNLRAGIEHIYAQRWLEDDGAPLSADTTGSLHRIQGAFRFQF